MAEDQLERAPSEIEDDDDAAAPSSDEGDVDWGGEEEDPASDVEPALNAAPLPKRSDKDKDWQWYGRFGGIVQAAEPPNARINGKQGPFHLTKEPVAACLVHALGPCRMSRELGDIFVVDWGTSKIKPKILRRFGLADPIDGIGFPRILHMIGVKEDGKTYYATRKVRWSPSMRWLLRGAQTVPEAFVRKGLLFSAPSRLVSTAGVRIVVDDADVEASVVVDVLTCWLLRVA